jgi:gluconokinase
VAEVFVLMGVCGCGKTTVGRGLSAATDGPFIEGDEYHSPANVQKMESGTPLTDEDRAEWLRRLRDHLVGEFDRSGPPAWVTCSALKQVYRDVLLEAGPVQFIYLKGSEAVLRGRMAARQDHYMPASLLESQWAILEEPAEAIVVDIADGSEAVVATVLKQMGRS